MSEKVIKIKSNLIGKRTYQFDPKLDLKRVEPASVLLLSEVLASGVVPPDSSDLDFNDIDNPDNIAGRVTNVFDAIDMSRELASQARSESKPTSTPSQPITGGSPNPSPDSSSTSKVSTLSGD